MITLTFNCSLELAEKLLATVRVHENPDLTLLVAPKTQQEPQVEHPAENVFRGVVDRMIDSGAFMSDHARKVEQMLVSAKGDAKIRVLEQVKASTKLTDYEKDYLCRQ